MSLPAENELPASPSPSFKCFTGVDIAFKDFTAATTLPGGKSRLEKKPFEQTAQGFSHFLVRLAAAADGIPPQEHLVVMESTGPYWVALAVYLTQKGYVVSVINPKQAHDFAGAIGLKPKTISLMLRPWLAWPQLCNQLPGPRLPKFTENCTNALLTGPVYWKPASNSKTNFMPSR